MFTGIVETTGKITAINATQGGKRLRIDVGQIAGDCALGASVCVSGVCLTVADIHGDEIDFDVVTETFNRSTLGSKRVGDVVNLERSLKVGGRLDGHFVQGHVDAVAVVTRIQPIPGKHIVRLRVDTDLRAYIVPKGSITIDGVSLTIASVDGSEFEVALIPTTLQHTTISRLQTGDRVNIETDIIARTIVHQLSLANSRDGVTMETLREAGFA